MISSLNPNRVCPLILRTDNKAGVCGERLAADQRCLQLTYRLLSVKYDVILRLTLSLI